MRTIAAAAAAATLWSATAGAQLAIPPEYALPPQVPAGGCVWGNVVYSDGAIVEQVYAIVQKSYSRCTNGKWRQYRSFEEASIAKEDSPVLTDTPGRAPTPLQ